MNKEFGDVEIKSGMRFQVPDGPSELHFGIRNVFLYASGGGKRGGLQQLYAFDGEGQPVEGFRSSVNFGPEVQGYGNTLPAIYQELDGLWYIRDGGIGALDRHVMPVQTFPLISDLIKRNKWTVLPTIEGGEMCQVDFSVGGNDIQIADSPDLTGAHKIKGGNVNSFPYFQAFTVGRDDSGIVLGGPTVPAPHVRIISLPDGIALCPLTPMQVTRSLVS